MVVKALALSALGRAVYILAATEREADRIRQMVGDDHGGGIKVETPERTFDWHTMTIPGAHSNCVVLVDHFTIESRFGELLQEWIRYDQPNDVETSARPIFTCGTKRVESREVHRVVCATCGGGGTTAYRIRDEAARACVRDSTKPCRKCGAR